MYERKQVNQLLHFDVPSATTTLRTKKPTQLKFLSLSLSPPPSRRWSLTNAEFMVPSTGNPKLQGIMSF